MIGVFTVLCFVALASAGIANIDSNLSPVAEDVSSKFVIVTPRDTVFGQAPPYLHFEFLVQSQVSTPKTAIVAFHADRKELIGDSSSWCCTKHLHSLGVCDTVGDIIIRSKGALQFTNALSDKFTTDSEMKVFYWNTLRPYLVTREEGGTSYVKVYEHIEIKHTGYWYFVTAQCADNITEHVTGTVEWRNPFGYLSGSSFANLPVYLTLVSGYFGLLLVWIGFVLFYRKGLMGLQHVITTTISVAFVETLLWSVYFTYYNYHGENLTTAMMLGAFLNALKVATIRTLILLVAMGYSITRLSLASSTRICVIILTIAYVLAESANDYIFIGKYVGLYIPDIADFITSSALTALNVIYVVWIGYCINFNMILLRSRNQVEKLGLYKVFGGALLIFMSLSVLCFIFQTAFSFAGYHDSLWSFWWVWESYWQFSYLLLTILIAFLWRPNPNNERYAFSTQIPAEEEDKEGEELSGDVQLGNVPQDQNDNFSSDDQASNDTNEEYDPDQLDNLAL